jgi:hypothetical protein
MTPRPEIHIKSFFQSILDQVGPKSPYGEQLEQEARFALNSKDYEKLQAISGELAGLEDLPHDLQDIYDQFSIAIRKANIQDRDVRLARDQTPRTAVELLQVADKEGIDTTKKEKRVKGDWQVEHAQPKALLALIKKDNQGEFIYLNHLSIAPLIINEESKAKNSKISTRYAADSINYWKRHQADALKYDAEREDTSLSIRGAYYDLREKNIEKGDEAWFEYYDYAIENYGNMSINQFKKDVLLRDMRGKRPMKDRVPQASVKKKSESIAKRVGGRSIKNSESSKEIKPNELLSHPQMFGVEIVLSTRLRNRDVIKGIEGIIGSENIYDTARRNGWNHANEKNAESALKTSCIRANDERKRLGKNAIEAREQYEISLFIQQTLLPIMAFSHDQRKVWTRAINRTNLEALKFLNAITREITGSVNIYKRDMLKAELFPDPKKLELQGMKRFDR